MLVLLVFASFVNAGYSQHIKADFTFQLDSFDCSTFKFTNTSTGTITSCDWSFGDGVNSTVYSPSHTYSTGIGTQVFQVRLQIVLIDSLNSIFETDTITETVVISTCDSCDIATFIELDGDSTIAYTGTLINRSKGNINKEHWDFGDGSSSDLHTPTHLYANPGRYTITYSAYDTLISCKRTSSVTFTIDSMGYVKRKAFLLTVVDANQLGVANVDVLAASVYPNPSNGKVYIQSPNENLLKQMKVMSSDGKVIYSGEFLSTIDISAYSNGIYLLELISESGSAFVKLIKS